jgi:hypothetical protein
MAPGFFHCLGAGTQHDFDEAPEMGKRWQQRQRPHRHDDASLVRGGREGMYWQSADGLVVHVAAAERAGPAHDESRAAVPLHAIPRDARGAAGPAGLAGLAGLAVALWMRLFSAAA